MPTTIRELLDTLPKDARQRLIYALNADISLVEKGPNGTFVGVHVGKSNPHIVIQQTSGNWSSGIVR